MKLPNWYEADKIPQDKQDAFCEALLTLMHERNAASHYVRKTRTNLRARNYHYAKKNAIKAGVDEATITAVWALIMT